MITFAAIVVTAASGVICLVAECPKLACVNAVMLGMNISIALFRLGVLS